MYGANTTTFCWACVCLNLLCFFSPFENLFHNNLLSHKYYIKITTYIFILHIFKVFFSQFFYVIFSGNFLPSKNNKINWIHTWKKKISENFPFHCWKKVQKNCSLTKQNIACCAMGAMFDILVLNNYFILKISYEKTTRFQKILYFPSNI
jgi:hypothetical protein